MLATLKYTFETLFFIGFWNSLSASPPDHRPLTKADFANGRAMTHPPVGDHKEGAPGKFESDIDLDGKPLGYYLLSFPDQTEYLQRQGNPGAEPQRNAVKDTMFRWPGGQVPYAIGCGFTDTERETIAHAIDVYHRKTCIRWVEYSGQPDYVYFVKEGGCWSKVGRRGKEQKISIDSGCMHTGIIQHEMMHALGFFHEQSRADRDLYVRIRWENIKPTTTTNFMAYGLDRITHLGTEYDYNSVMHYGPKDFSRNGQPTIVAIKSGAGNMGQRDGLSTNDVVKLKKMYCNDGGEELCTDQYFLCKYFPMFCFFTAPFCCKTCAAKNPTEQLKDMAKAVDQVAEKILESTQDSTRRRNPISILDLLKPN